MSEKILFTDLDGTLLNSAKKVSPGMQLLLSKMVLAGNRLVLTSGRALPSVLKVAKNAGLLFPDTVIIAANGNEVYDCGTKTFLMRKSVPIEIAEDIISMAQEESLYLHSYSDTCVVAPKDGVEVKHYCNFSCQHVSPHFRARFLHVPSLCRVRADTNLAIEKFYFSIFSPFIPFRSENPAFLQDPPW